MDITAFVIITIIIIFLFIIISYNSIVNLHKKVEQSKSTIEVYLKQRFDLIPNLVDTVKAYAQYEKETLEKIISLRESYLKDTSNLEKGYILNSKCNDVILLAEKYPDLKSSDNFLHLQKNLTKMESQLQAARRIYNSDVTMYNTKILSFPTIIIAKIFGFKEASLFDIKDNEKDNIKIDF